MKTMRKVQYVQTSRPNRVINIEYDDGTIESGLESAILPKLQEWLAKGNRVEARLPKGHPNHKGRLAYTPNSSLEVPAPDTRVRRYMAFDQLCSLLTSKALWFSRIVSFQASDPFEGTIPLKSRNPEQYGVLANHFAHINMVAAFNLVCCFNIAQHESNAMWNVYGKGANSVAIVTTFDRLAAAFGPFAGYEVIIGKIKYIDYAVDEIGTDNFLRPAMHKAPYYDYEQELRCLVIDDGDDNIFPLSEPNPWAHEGEFQAHHIANFKRGVQIPVDVNQLIQEVVIGPRAEAWFADTVVKTLAQFNLSVPVHRSSLLG